MAWAGTPGPWRYKDDGVGGCRNITAKPGNPRHRQVKRTEVATTVGLYDDEQDKANAYGMAAVPQLVEAALLLVQYDGEDQNDGVAMMLAYNRALEAAKAALKAARVLP
jgi:hypothetical protein